MDYAHRGATVPWVLPAVGAAGAAGASGTAGTSYGGPTLQIAPAVAAVAAVPVMAAAYATRSDQVAALGRAIGEAEVRQDTAALRALCREGLGMIARLELAALLLLEERTPPQV